jgi:DNA-binding MarR family transcriptional regulator
MWRALRTMYQQLDSTLDRDLARDSGLSGADYALLVPLSESPQQWIRARELRTAVGWDRSRLAHQLRRMEQRGLVIRQDCPTDARGTIITLTASGRDAIERAAPAHAAAVRRYFIDQLHQDEVAALQAIADRVLKGLSQEPSDRSPS